MGTNNTDRTPTTTVSDPRQSDLNTEEKSGPVGSSVPVDSDSSGFVETVTDTDRCKRFPVVGTPCCRQTKITSNGPYEGDPITDGGESVGSDNSNQTDLMELFVDVTGTEKLVETQNGERQARTVATGEEQSLAGDVLDVTREDGLDDTLPKPEGGDQS